MSKAYDPATEGAQMSFDGRMSYSDYLNLDKLLTSQNTWTNTHDEMLFIIQQTLYKWVCQERS